MREVPVKLLSDKIAELCISSNCLLPPDVEAGLLEYRASETFPTAQGILDCLIENKEIARKERLPLCQDTGMACIFLEIGQEVHLTGGDLNEAVNEGVRRGYQEGYLRKSVVRDPLRRENTGDNTPAVLHLSIVPGEQIKVTVAPKGFGSENMSRIKMFTPSASLDDIVGFVVETARIAGSNPCPPMVLGVGIGGDFEKCALLAKMALCRPVSEPNQDPFYAELEQRMLDEVNALGVGPQGFGGDTTALCVHIEPFPTHIAGLPVAVNVGCHVTRHKMITI